MALSTKHFDLTPPTPDQRKSLIEKLSPEEREVLLNRGTEAAFCGLFVDNKQEGIYSCRFCGLPLFSSQAKYDSKTGWPSFFQPIANDHLLHRDDTSHQRHRVELVCARCHSHLGHVFPDGPLPSGQRYCLNSISLRFNAQGERLPDLLQRHGPESQII